jgi:hypothetical protein
MGGKLTTAGFIERAKKVYGDKYDYSKVNYVNGTTKVTIICPKHGEFQQAPSLHSAKNKPRGCPACGRERQISKATKSFDDFVIDAKETHGDRYIYKPENYSNARQKTKIICPEHGIFMQTPDAHIRGQGCPECRDNMTSERSLLSIEEINKRLNISSDGRVSILAETYKGINSNADFICTEHGRYTRLVNSTLTANPCLPCAKKYGAYLHHSTKSFEKVIKEKFGDKYEIEDFEYKGNTTPITLKCKTHGAFTLMAQSIHRSPGCPKCAYESSMDARRKALNAKAKSTLPDRYEKWVIDAHSVHGDRYDYSLVDYKSARGKVDVICPIHGVFQVTPNSHLNSICRKCAEEDLKGLYTDKYFKMNPECKDNLATLYYLKFTQGDLQFYKVGITTETIARRFSKLGKTDVTYTVLGEHKTTLFEAYLMEQKIQSSHGEIYRYLPVLKGYINRNLRIGQTECFSKKLSDDVYKQYFSKTHAVE